MQYIKPSRQLSPAVLFIIIFLSLTSAALVINLIVRNTGRERRLESYKLQINSQMDLQKQLLLSELDKVESELFFLTKLNEMQEYKEKGEEKDRLLIENELIEFMKISSNYDQIRFLDKSGMETIRVNLVDGVPSAVPKEELQDKSRRYYFKESITLPEGAVYISPFDLNVENNEIEYPVKPMLRFAAPIYRNNGEIAGVMIFNFLGRVLIDNLAVSTRLNPGTYSLLNADGYWLYNDNPDVEWGFMYDEKDEENLMKSDPVLWSSLVNDERRQLLTDDALYIAEKINLHPVHPCSLADEFFVLLNKTTTVEMRIDREYLRKSLIKKMLPVVFFIIFITALLTGITIQRNKYRNALEESALHDQLTGLPNRKLLMERGEMAVMNARRYNHAYAVMFIDLDGFKPVNDQYGHATGDWLLKEVGKILNSSIRDTDTAARFGGDEFIILLSRISNTNDCGVIAEKILSALTSEIRINGNTIHIGASIGIVAVQEGKTPEFSELIRTADDAMYEIKKEGKNNYKIVQL